MKKSIFVVLVMFAFAVILTGCATKGDLEKVQMQEQQTNLKADQALKASQEANEAAAKAAEAARLADERAKAAEERARMSEERTKAAEERAEKYDATFKKSMKK